MAKFSVTLNLKASSRTTGSAENDSDEFRVPAVNNDGLLFLKLGHKRQDGLSVRWCLQSALVFTWQSPETSQLNSLQSADVLCHHKVHIWSKLSGSSFILSWFLFFFQSVYQVQKMICSPRVTDKLCINLMWVVKCEVVGCSRGQTPPCSCSQPITDDLTDRTATRRCPSQSPCYSNWAAPSWC